MERAQMSGGGRPARRARRRKGTTMDPQRVQVDPGAVVEASDGRLGTVNEVLTRPDSGALASLLVRRDATGDQITISSDLIESVPSRREVRLRVGRDQVGASAEAGRGTPEPRERAEEREQVRVPIAEERVVAGKRPVQLGEIRVHKRVEEREEVIRQPLMRDEVTIERVKASRPVEGPVGPREEGEWLIVPIVEEVLVVQKRLMVTEEIRIRRRAVTEEKEIRETVRRERAEVEDTTGRTAEPRAANARDTEPPLRRGGQSSDPGGESWEQLRQEIWEEGSHPRAATERPAERGDE